MEILYLLIPAFLSFLFQTLFPGKRSEQSILSPYDIQRYKEKYTRLEIIGVLFLTILAIVIGLLIFFIGVKLTERIHSPSYEYILITPNTLWGFLGVILGIGLARFLLEFIVIAKYGDEYYRYLAYSNMKHGWDGLKVWKMIESILVPLGLTLFILGLNWHVRIDHNNRTVEINELLTFENKVYKLSDISNITYTPLDASKGDSKLNKEYYTIKMNDGYEWNSKTYRFFTDQEEDYTRLYKNVERLKQLISN